LDAGAPLWQVSGLKEGQTLFITPKPGSSWDLYQFTDEFQGLPAFSITSEHNTLVGSRPAGVEVQSLLAQAKSDVGRVPEYVSWFYEITVVDEFGRIVAVNDEHPGLRLKVYP
jgi:hypothetical protein